MKECDTTRRWVVSFTSWPNCPRGNSHHCYWTGSVVVPRPGLHIELSFVIQRIEAQFPGCTACSPVTRQSSLSRFLQTTVDLFYRFTVHFFNSLNDKHQPMHFTFNNILV